jgi:hypothetical protein
MSFLIDPPWLYATGYAYGRVLPRGAPATQRAHRATAAAFLATSVSLYANLAWTRPIWERCHAESGRDWMLNSGVFRFEHREVGKRAHTVAALLFVTYPWWLALGERAGRKSRG